MTELEHHYYAIPHETDDSKQWSWAVAKTICWKVETFLVGGGSGCWPTNMPISVSMMKSRIASIMCSPKKERNSI